MGFFSRYRFVLTAAIVLLAAFAFFSYNAGRERQAPAVGRYVLELVGPAQQSITGLGGWLDQTWRHYFALVHAARENDELQKELARQRQQLADLEELRLVNQRLRQLLKLQQELPFPQVSAEVVAADPTGNFRMVVINVGASDGVKPGMPVICLQGAVGRVVWCSPHYAKVLLLTDPNSGLDVYVQRTRVRGVVEGLEGSQLGMKYVLHTDPIAVGDTVLASGAAGNFPKGILVGTVQTVVKEGKGVFQQVVVEPSVDFARLEEVIVLLHRRSLGD